MSKNKHRKGRTLFSVAGVIVSFLMILGCGTNPDRPGSAGRILPDEPFEIAAGEDGYSLVFEGIPVARLTLPELENAELTEVEFGEPDNGWRRVRLVWDVLAETQQDELSLPIEILLEPDFWWAPHLTPEEGYVAAQHVFRSPALIVQDGIRTIALVPDLDSVGKNEENPWFLDFDAVQKKMWVGLVKTDIPEHVLFKKSSGMMFSPGRAEISFFITVYNDREPVRNPWRKTSAFLWGRWGHHLFVEGEPVRAPLQTYVRRTYDWAFKSWGRFVWQEFDLNGRRVGAPQFIVNISQSPNYPEEWYQREFLSIWNQAWFSSLRSASGLYRFARLNGDEELLRRARLTKELALAAPMKDGIFPAVIRTDNGEVEIAGKILQRPEPWEKAYWTNSNRSPRDHGIKADWYHVLDASWTCLLMLRWYEDLEQDERLVEYARTYAEKLLILQEDSGFFPGWLNPDSLEPGPVMNETPETSMSVTFLLKLSDITNENKYRQAALKAMDAVLSEIVPHGRWEDFETYWSCCRWGREMYLGRKIERNAMHKQNSFAMFWTAEALLASYKATGETPYLHWGRRTL
ncbi:MAG: hypothetical protein MUP70_04525, partial [Candidatus Aminicenantes bacterium]|nr:hypothetical protein [Candidatus Aminicenantes bacterium]